MKVCTSSYEDNNDTDEEHSIDSLYLQPDNGYEHTVFKLHTKQKISVARVTLILMAKEIEDRVNEMGNEEGELE